MQTPGVTAAQLSWMQQRLKVENQIKSSASWFYLIAALSIINTFIWYVGVKFTFVIGLGFTQLIDGFATGVARRVSPGAGTLVTIVGIGLDLVVAGVFVLIGVLARKQKRWAFIVGTILYFLDGLIFLALGLWLSVAFHAFALVAIWGGFTAIRKLNELPAIPLAQPAPLQPLAPTATDPQLQPASPLWPDPAAASWATPSAPLLSRPLRVSHWPVRVVGWVCLIFFGFITLVALFNDGEWSTLVFLFFALLSLPLVLAYGTTEMDQDKIQHKNWLGRYQIPGREVKQIDFDAAGSNIVFRGDNNKELVVSGKSYWYGKDKKSMLEFYNAQVQRLQIPLHETMLAAFKFSRNTRVA